MGKKLAKAQRWPGWYTDSQLAAEQAQHLASQLRASVNAYHLAAGWLALNAPAGTAEKAARRRQPTQQQRRQQQAQAAAARQYLTQAGVTAAIAAVITALLAILWAAAFTLGWQAAVLAVGVGEIQGAEKALEDLMRAGRGRVAGIIATRVRRLERVLLNALHDGTSVDELAQQISDILGSRTSAWLAGITETTWASGFAAYHAYLRAGVTYKRWQSRNDSKVCPLCRKNQAAGSIPVRVRFPSGDLFPPAHPQERCALLPGTPPKRPSGTAR